MLWWCLAGAALCVAVLAGVADWRQRNRADLDRISLADWRSIQMYAVIAAAMCAVVAQHG